MLVLILGMLFTIKSEVKAQNLEDASASGVMQSRVVRNGRVFVQQTSTSDSTKTDYEYQDKDGNKHTIYLSKTGKAYIYVYSKKTGKGYRRYLPKITAMLKEADNAR